MPMNPIDDTIPTHPLTGLAPHQITAFRKRVYGWYRDNLRTLPWRETRDPYAILVSEIMLQQTQVDRVIGKFAPFLALFPDFAALARAPLQEVLSAWQGLGYNRRAIALKKCAETVMEHHGGNLPRSVDALQALPGIGPYTARAIAAFAFGLPAPFIETNIRAVFIHHFFADREGVRDAEVLPLVAATLDRTNPRDWYSALMDYGTALKKLHKNPARRSAHHVRQAPFRGSNRELRSRILKVLLAAPRLTEEEIIAQAHINAEKVRTIVDQLEKEGFIRKERGRFVIR
ncbi:MAG TPA: winged helix-turn-helix transcriptional regulator [Geobacteraceae bacterium]|nr:winged helix-turn-helix transcriptional regulator [Geobacteraceae bacterium]